MTVADRSERLKRLSPEQRARLLAALREDAVRERGGEASEGASGRIPRRGGSGPAPASLAQQRLWLLESLAPGGAAYNLPFAVRLTGRLDAAALEGSLREAVRRHEALRTVFADGADEVADFEVGAGLAPAREGEGGRYVNDSRGFPPAREGTSPSPTFQSARMSVEGEGGPIQVVLAEPRLVLPRVDLRQLPAAVREAEAGRLAREEARRGFDLRRGPLLRASLLLLGTEESVLVVNLHHIVSDAWSNALLMKEVGALYAAWTHGEPASLSEPPIQYADYAVWQRQQLQGDRLERLLRYWRGRLAGAPPVLELPADFPRPAERSHLGGTVACLLPEREARALEALAQGRGATLYMALLAAFQILLGRYADTEDVLVGSPVANRGAAETEGLLGFFVNMIVLRTDLAGDPTFPELLDRVRRVSLEALEHAALPFERLVEELRPGRDPGVHPVFQVAFGLQNAPRAALELPGVTAVPLDLDAGAAKLDLTLSVEPAEGGWRLFLEHSRELFTPATAERLLGHLRTLLAGILARPESRISELPLLGEAERHQVLAEWPVSEKTRPTPHPPGPPLPSPSHRAGEGGRDRSRGDEDREGPFSPLPGEGRVMGEGPGVRGQETAEATVHGLVEAWAEATPGAVALDAPEGEVTYRELCWRASRLADFLRSNGVLPGTPVGVALDRSAGLVVSLLGVLEAGGAYVPLDPAYPAERLAFMLADSRPPLLLAQRGTVASLAGPAAAAGSRLVVLEDSWERGRPARPFQFEKKAGEDARAPRVSPDDLAYILYTSGSTGRPKGVAVPHRAVVRLVRGADYARLAPDEVLLQLAPVSFDASTLEIWGALANGARLALPPPGPPSLRDLAGALERHRVTTLWLTAGLFHEAVDGMAELEPGAFAGLRQLLAGGDVLSPPHVRRFLAAVPGCALINGYGPTENTTFTCCHPLRDPAEVGTPVPIGRPIAGTRVYVLDRHLRPVPAGVPGELLAGGEGLARGYVGSPALTAERFVPDPFSGFSGDSGPPGTRLYRTGDRARWLPDGTLELLGRLDRQVKIRGFRIEPAEIESALCSHPAVRQAAVTAVADARGDKRLAAWVVPREEAADDESRWDELVDELRAHLGARLPAYMLPASWMRLAELPLGPNGKVDRRALPAPSPDRAGRVSAAPRTPAEEIVAGLWADALGIERVGTDEDFFALGGHSLLAARIVARARQALGVDLPLASLFDHPTVAGMAAEVERLRGGDKDGKDEDLAPLPQIPPVAQRGRLPLSFSQERLWILDRFEPGTAAYNIPAALRLRGALDVAAFHRALDRVVRRHDSLRTVFETVGGEPVQRVLPADGMPLALPVIDLRALPEAERRAAVARRTADVAATPFDLARGPLLRPLLLRTGEREHALLLAVHHIVSDGWSMGVLVRELGAFYDAAVSGVAAALPELPVQYADFAFWQRQRLRGEVLERQLAWWRGRLAGAPPGLELPTDRPRPAVRAYRGGRGEMVVAGDLADRLRALTRRQGATLFMTLLAAFEVLLQRLSGQSDVVVGTPIAGRGRPELEELIGLFLNSLVLRTDLSGNPSFRELVGRVRETALGAYAHQDLPFEKLLDELKPERDLSRTPLFQIFFNMLNFPWTAMELAGVEIEPLAMPELPSKFDLTVYAEERGREIHLEFVYNADLFAASRIEEMLRQYQGLLAQATGEGDRERGIDELSLLTPAAAAVLPDPRAPLGDSWLGPAHERFAAEVRRAPGRLAVADKDESWTYAELEARANRLAQALIAGGAGEAGGVGRGDVVAIWAQRSARLVWAIVGVMKSGGAFVVLDPAHPPGRLVDCLRLARPKAWIEIAAAGPPPPEVEEVVAGLGCRRIVLPLPAAAADPLAGRPAEDPGVRVGPDDLAYIAFTSGSTGVPKGILGRHGPLSHFIPWQREAFGLGESDRFSLLSGLSHDPLQRDVFTPLQLGAAVCVPDPAEISRPGWLAEWMRREAVTVAHLTPAMGQLLTELPAGASRPRLPDLRLAFFVGDVLKRRDVARLRELAPAMRCINFYGSTETQRAVGHHAVRTVNPRAVREDGGAAGLEKEVLPLGRGVEDVQLLVLDAHGHLAGIGELGEIHVRSPHIARGYLGDPAGTAERFVPDPSTGDRVYRTGDLGRYLPDGEIEFAGRADFQVKIRGFRIEPGEIAAQLGRHPRVRESLVLARDGADGEKQLVAWFVPDVSEGEIPNGAELRAFLKRQLPEPMIPAAFVPLPRMPLNPNGKIDRRALPDPSDDHRKAAAEYAAPRTETERTVTAVLQEVLGLERVGIHDNFFELGGNSLLLVRVHARLRDVLGGGLQVVDLFSHPTAASLTTYLSRSEAEPAAAPGRQSDERVERIEAGQDRVRRMQQLRRARA